jgi:hypothetical protein
MKKYLFYMSLFLGICFDIFFWGKVLGISFPIFVLLCFLLGYFLIKTERRYPARNTLLLLIPILFLATMTILRREPLTSLLSYSLTLCLMAILAMTYLNGQWVSFNLRDYVFNLFQFFTGILALPWSISNQKNSQQKRGEKSWSTTIKPIVRGVLLALPVLLVFTALFASADLIFAERVNSLIASLRLENLPEYLFRGFIILAFTYLYAGIILFAANRTKKADLSVKDKSILTPFLGFTETSIILAGLCLLFFFFLLIQFQYFLAGQANITSAGFTYAEYARRGFAELIAVAVFSITLIVTLSTISKRKTGQQVKVFTALVVVLVLSVLIILVSAFKRLFLYEAAYGFTRFRTYAHVFIIWLGVMLVAVAIMEIIKRQRQLVNVILAVSLGFIVSLNLLNVDSFIVNQNITRSIQGKELDVSYLSSLSVDAVPALIQNFSTENFPTQIHEGIGAALVCFQQNMGLDAERLQGWQSYHLSDWNAERELHQIQQDLQDYRLAERDGLSSVISPTGTEFLCFYRTTFD